MTLETLEQAELKQSQDAVAEFETQEAKRISARERKNAMNEHDRALLGCHSNRFSANRTALFNARRKVGAQRRASHRIHAEAERVARFAANVGDFRFASFGLSHLFSGYESRARTHSGSRRYYQSASGRVAQLRAQSSL